jgi:ABC-type transport system involved in multi-copper enzyme maturation permease subunit
MRAFFVLAGEAFRDGLRRRVAFVVAITLIAGIASAQSCTRIGLGWMTSEGVPIDPAVVAGYLAPALFLVQALSLLAIAGLVAADHLARPLAEGNAVLWLARPVSRRAWAGARLVGALGIALVAGALLLGGTAALLFVRQGVAIAPALLGAAAAGLACVVVAALAMAASLVVGRIAVVLATLVGIGFVAAANLAGIATTLALGGEPLGGLFGLVDRYGPPLVTAIASGVAAWNPHVEPGHAFAATMARLAAWAVASIALLLVLFERREIES